MALMETFGRNLRTLLAYNDKAQKDLAEYLNVGHTTVSDWCKGENAPRFNRMDEICAFLHCDVNDLLTEQMISYTEFRNRGIKEELIAEIENLDGNQMARVLAYVRGINESN